MEDHPNARSYALDLQPLLRGLIKVIVTGNFPLAFKRKQHEFFAKQTVKSVWLEASDHW